MVRRLLGGIKYERRIEGRVVTKAALPLIEYPNRAEIFGVRIVAETAPIKDAIMRILSCCVF